MLQKKIIIAALAGLVTVGFSAAASAAVPGAYVEGQLGWGNVNLSTPAGANTGKTSGVAGRASVGYQFDCNWAVEMGYKRFRNTTITNAAGTVSTTAKPWALDVVAKGILPLQNCFSLYGKLGAAYVKGTTGGGFSNDNGKIQPTAGIGVSYDITPNVPVSLGYDRTQKVGGSAAVQSTNFVGVGIGYHFG